MKEEKIGNLCTITSSKRIFANQYVSEGVPFYRSKEIIEKNDFKQPTEPLYIAENIYEQIKAKYGVPKKGDMLLTSVGTLGIPYIVKDERFYFKDGNLTWFKEFKDNLSSEYLYYWITSAFGRQSLLNIAIGSSQPALTIEILKKYKISVPERIVQDKAIEILSAYDRTIRNNNKRIKTLEQMAENLYKEWFVRFRFPGYEKAEFVDGVPKGWGSYRLDEVCDINKNSLKKSDKIDKIQYLDTGSLTENNITNLEEYFKSDAPSRAKRKVKKNSILFSTVRPALRHYGIMKKVPQNMIVSTGFAVLDAKYDIANIIYMYLSSELVLSYCQMIAEGAVATYPTIKPEEIGKIKIILPPLEIAAEWNEKLEAYFSMKLKLIEQNQNLIKQRDLLLPRLMSGKLQVK